jgi:hypothetical protein
MVNPLRLTGPAIGEAPGDDKSPAAGRCRRRRACRTDRDGESSVKERNLAPACSIRCVINHANTQFRYTQVLCQQSPIPPELPSPKCVSSITGPTTHPLPRVRMPIAVRGNTRADTATRGGTITMARGLFEQMVGKRARWRRSFRKSGEGRRRLPRQGCGFRR